MKKNSKKLDIIKVGFVLLDKKGYNGTGISEIINEAEIPKGSFYHYFKNKEEFVLNVIEYYSKKITDDIHMKLSDKKIDPKQRILSLYTNYLYCIENSIKFPYSNFACKLSQEVSHMSLPIMQASNNVFIAIRDAHTSCIKEAKELNLISNNISNEKLAELIIYAWEGANIRTKGINKTDSLHDFVEMLGKVLLK